LEFRWFQPDILVKFSQKILDGSLLHIDHHPTIMVYHPISSN
jgi:hypothetical protein